jgi:D-alanine-D-alanine ligase
MLPTAIPTLLSLHAQDKAQLRVLLLAKHANADGGPDAVDGNHAIYHCELRDTLRAAGFKVAVADRYEALFERPDADFVIPLLNRGGFQNSEMLAPLLLERHGVAYLGARPMLRGWSDDKHLAKLAAAAAGVPTARWMCVRTGQPRLTKLDFEAERYIVKPNAEELLAQRHDVIVEEWLPARDIAVPVVGGPGGAPWLMTPMAYSPIAGVELRSYAEKRGLVPTADDPLEPVADTALLERLLAYTQKLAHDYWPFDYGRFEYRHDPATGALSFMEVNLSCNLWSRKTISRAARLQGISHAELVEHIVAHSMMRQNLIQPTTLRKAA